MSFQYMVLGFKPKHPSGHASPLITTRPGFPPYRRVSYGMFIVTNSLSQFLPYRSVSYGKNSGTMNGSLFHK